MENKNVTPNRVIKKKAREQLKGNWTSAVLVCFIYWLILFSIGSIDAIASILNNVKNGFLLSGQTEDTSFGLACVIIQILIGGPFAYGIWNFFKNLGREESPKIEDLFKGFKFLVPNFLINLIVSIFQFLWSLLFILPLIIAFTIIMLKSVYEVQFTSLPLVVFTVAAITVTIILTIILLRYSMVFLVYNDNKELSAMEVVKASVSMMKGYKFKLFLMNLSFIGWFILSILTLGIGFLWLYPYINASTFNFYEDIISKDKKGDLMEKATIEAN
ncbi:DUF975 family protein [Haloimpatiens sp. FM7315]|uniref:DUF975 family protein n=1 Tax=Haloimpatiens sp. FM7315 TaxID=3298609 RepID=UPI0035A300AE